MDSNFLAFVNAWVELTSVLNELSRSMGQPDFYPFVLSGPAVTKLHFVHRFVVDQRRFAVPKTPPTIEAPPMPDADPALVARLHDPFFGHHSGRAAGHCEKRV